MRFGTIDGEVWEHVKDGDATIWEHIKSPAAYGPLRAYTPGGYQEDRNGVPIARSVNPAHVLWWDD